MLFFYFLLIISAFCGSLDKLRVGVISRGDCEHKAHTGDKLKVHYRGTLRDTGAQFDASYDRGTPFDLTLGSGMVIQGWEQGLLGMCLGEKRKIQIPSHLGYGSRGAGASIPPDADLVFEVEMEEINGVKRQN